MITDFITGLHREVKYSVNNGDNVDVFLFEVRGINLLNLAKIINHEIHGSLLLSFLGDFDLEKEKEQIKETVIKLIDTDYVTLVYHFVAACVYMKDEETGAKVSLIDDFMTLDDYPYDLMIELLMHSIELSIPTSEKRLKDNVKKIQALLIKNQK